MDNFNLAHDQRQDGAAVNKNPDSTLKAKLRYMEEEKAVQVAESLSGAVGAYDPRQGHSPQAGCLAEAPAGSYARRDALLGSLQQRCYEKRLEAERFQDTAMRLHAEADRYRNAIDIVSNSPNSGLIAEMVELLKLGVL